MKEFLKKNWLTISVGVLSALLGVLTLLTVVKLKEATPVAPTVPKKKPRAVVSACTLTFKLALEITPTPAILSPTPTEALTATSESTNEAPVCNELAAQPLSGETPLVVNFTGSGVDLDGKITAFEFSFGDGETKTVEKDTKGEASHSLEHTYSSPGTYLASLRIRDDNDSWSEISENCQAKIEIQEKVIGGEEPTPTPKEIAQLPTTTPTPEEITQVPTATSTPIPVPEVPEAGIALPTILTILSGSLLILLGTLL